MCHLLLAINGQLALLQAVSVCSRQKTQPVVKVFWQQAALPAHIDGSVVFARWRHVHLIQNMLPLGPAESKTQNGVSIGSAVFVGFTTVTGRPTDQPTDHSANTSCISVSIDIKPNTKTILWMLFAPCHVSTISHPSGNNTIMLCCYHAIKSQQDGVVQEETDQSTLSIEVFAQLHRLKLQFTTVEHRTTVDRRYQINTVSIAWLTASPTITVALRSRWGHHIFFLWFLSSSFFFFSQTDIQTNHASPFVTIGRIYAST